MINPANEIIEVEQTNPNMEEQAMSECDGIETTKNPWTATAIAVYAPTDDPKVIAEQLDRSWQAGGCSVSITSSSINKFGPDELMQLNTFYQIDYMASPGQGEFTAQQIVIELFEDAETQVLLGTVGTD